MISTILVPTDGSKTATKAVKYAADLAKELGASVALLAVVERIPYVAQTVPGAVPIAEPIEQYIRDAMVGVLEEAKGHFRRRGLPVKTAVRYGHPVEAILREARKIKADLIVIGSHGRSALKAAILGSVTFGLIHEDNRIPVLVVRK